jgi:hypothetical protein
VLGRPLQPNPAGGPPTVPQALNRYAATPLGQPGVAEGTEQASNLLLNTFEKATFKAALTYFGFRPLQMAYVPKVQTWGTLSLRMSKYAWSTYYSDPAVRALFKDGVKYKNSFYTWELKYGAKQSNPNLFDKFEVEGQGPLTIRQGVKGKKIVEVLFNPKYELDPDLKLASGAAWAFVLSGGVQLVNDWGDPYFTWGQKAQRAGITEIEGIVVYGFTTGGAVMLGLNPVGAALLGLGTGFVWFSTAHPWVMETFGPSRERRLAPLP